MGSNKTEIIAITANVSPKTKLRCKLAGMDGFLEKPIDQDSLKNQLLKSWRRIEIDVLDLDLPARRQSEPHR